MAQQLKYIIRIGDQFSLNGLGYDVHRNIISVKRKDQAMMFSNKFIAEQMARAFVSAEGEIQKVEVRVK